MRPSPGSRRSMTSPSATASKRHSEAGRVSRLIGYSSLGRARPSLVDTAREKSSVDDQDLSVDEARRVRGEEHARPRELVDLAESLEGRSREELPAASRRVEELAIQVRAKDPGADRVDRDAHGAPFDRE